MKLDRSVLLKELKHHFPELRGDINSEGGLLHFEVGAFYQFTQSKIDAGEVEIVKQCFNLAEKYYLNGNSNVKNAIGVSFAECFNFNSTKKNKREWAWDIFPLPLKNEYISVRGKLGI